MDIKSPGRGLMARREGVVTSVTPDATVVDAERYTLQPVPNEWLAARGTGLLILPRKAFWQEPVVKPGDQVGKRQLPARGVTHIHFQANVTIFSGLLLLTGFMMGLGMGAVFKYIPDYYPDQVGSVGGNVGVIGGVGGFICPILFGVLLQRTGLWTTCWMFFSAVALGCLGSLALVVSRMAARDTNT